MVNTKMVFYHPNYYKNLRKLARLRNRDQAISSDTATAASERAPGTGQNLTCDSNADGSEGSSLKLQAPSSKQQAIDETVPHCDIEEATSRKPQAPSDKHQAPSNKPQA